MLGHNRDGTAFRLEIKPLAASHKVASIQRCAVCFQHLGKRLHWHRQKNHLGIVKRAAAEANLELGKLDAKLAIELRWQGIRVNAIAPGMVETRMIADFTPETRRSLLNREPSGAPADPDDIAQAVAFLASEQARFVSGQVLFVDGGKSVGMPPL